MTIHVDTSEVRAVCSRLATAGPRVGAANAAIFKRTLLAIEADAKAFAPVDTGFLRSSISTEVTGDGRFAGITGEVGPTAEYGIFQEFGTSTQPGTPFLAPAFDRQVPGYLAALGQLAARETI